MSGVTAWLRTAIGWGGAGAAALAFLIGFVLGELRGEARGRDALRAEHLAQAKKGGDHALTVLRHALDGELGDGGLCERRPDRCVD